ncbi:acylphosphatase [Microbacterium sp. YJN-G]|uniref:acylphosphatase n=1 Tax=Microbacterium sp. YJN-G TaxID=2763257 RepID=UPI001877B8C0|nr:acylphosphatase [Microbacterium sp. YJN-G]
MRALRVVVRGGVQGVGYRWFVRDEAEQAGVTGWVRNRRDGSVEAELQGEAAQLEAVLDAMRAGPPAARVDELTVEETDSPTRSRGLEIRPTV